MAVLVFVVSAAAVVYVYAGYPLLLLIRARLRSRPVLRAPVRPSITVVIPAYNEAAVISRKLENTLRNGYPEDRMDVLVASDGSTDGTEAIVRGFTSERVRLLACPRRGKLAALNEAAAAATGEILVFTDADVLLDHGSLPRLIESFADPGVGGVTGRKAQLSDPAETGGRAAGGEGLYARYDEWQKRLEAEAGSAVASHGALHALRRSLYRPIEDTTVADDQAISARVVLQGYRLAYEHGAVARVQPPQEDRDEFQRKVRIANQVLRALAGLGPGLWTASFYSVQLVSHKLLRYLVPFFLLSLLAASAVLALRDGHAWWTVLAAQLLFYALALAGRALPPAVLRRVRGLGVPYYFCLVNAAAMAAVVSFLRGHRAAGWTPRSGFQTRSS